MMKFFPKCLITVPACNDPTAGAVHNQNFTPDICCLQHTLCCIMSSEDEVLIYTDRPGEAPWQCHRLAVACCKLSRHNPTIATQQSRVCLDSLVDCSGLALRGTLP